MRAIKLIIIILICVIIFIGCSNMKYNNLADKDELITEQYSKEQIETLITATGRGVVTFSEFKKDFKAQYVRQTHQGCYVVLSLEDGESAFICMNHEENVVNVVIKKDFLTKNEFLAQDVAQMTESEVLLYDPEAILLPISSVNMTAHIVKEGVFIIKYVRFSDDAFLDDPTVSSIEFYENDDIPTNDDILVRDVIPYILEIDKN